jgi:hypothetical protein
MVVGKLEALLFDTIKDDFKQKQKDISEMEGKLSYLLTVDSILVGLLTTIMGLSYFESRLKQLYSWPPALSLVILLISMLIGILAVFPRKIASEIKIEGVLEVYKRSNYDSILSELGGTMLDLIKNLRLLVNKKGRYLQVSWFLTIGALIVMILFIWSLEL